MKKWTEDGGTSETLNNGGNREKSEQFDSFFFFKIFGPFDHITS